MYLAGTSGCEHVTFAYFQTPPFLPPKQHASMRCEKNEKVETRKPWF